MIDLLCDLHVAMSVDDETTSLIAAFDDVLEKFSQMKKPNAASRKQFDDWLEQTKDWIMIGLTNGCQKMVVSNLKI